MEPEQKVNLDPIMQCPFSKAHKIAKDRYFHHIKVCDKRPELQPSYTFQIPFTTPDAHPKQTLTLEAAYLIEGKIFKIISIFSQELEMFNQPLAQLNLEVDVPFHESVKHAPQLKSLAGHILDSIPVTDLVIEGGAGTGMLSAYLAFKDKHINTETKRRFILMERERGFKHKFDRYVKFCGESVERVLCDLRAVDFQKLRSHYSAQNVTVIGKHLCGHATDCVLKWEADHYAIALCCHAKADGGDLLGVEFLRDMTPGELYQLCRMTSWQFAWKGQESLDLQQIEKQRLGTFFRQVLDCCRIKWLKMHKYWVKLVRYCSEVDSPECWLILAGKE
ncbi:Methyltransferase TRM13 [Spironucleus salmonicida]|uniref:tRNA:m(4)X modification enzyme TRM13 n=2 Tax=Spironucleus salmonicida TaxID=348837 RepID=A0A9P8LWJ8_9EUKA|nr:Methyltransferase TRM13 [Spironucleus salmonicida]